MNSGGNRPHLQRRKRKTSERLEPAAKAPAAKAPAPKPARTERPASPEQALERLRARTLDAVRELERLRTENELLAQRVSDLEREGGRTPDVILPFAETPEAMRAKMDEFIDALDAFLALDASGAPAASSAPAD